MEFDDFIKKTDSEKIALLEVDLVERRVMEDGD